MNLYYTEPDDWAEDEFVALQNDMKQVGFVFDRKAAIGEGAGGAGFETIIEIVIAPMAVGLLTNLLYDIAKKTMGRKPKDKGGPERLKHYRLVVHYDKTILSIDLQQPPEVLEIAIKEELPRAIEKQPWRAHQNGKHWDIF